MQRQTHFALNSLPLVYLYTLHTFNGQMLGTITTLVHCTIILMNECNQNINLYTSSGLDLRKTYTM